MSILEKDTAALIRVGDKVSIRARGKRGTYTAEFWHNGKHQKRSLKTADLRVARRRAVALEAELVTGVYTPALKTVTIADAVVEYMEMAKGNGRKHKTLVKYQGWLDKFTVFCIANNVKSLQQIAPPVFEKFRNECRKTLSGNTITIGLTIVKQLTKWASAAGRQYLAKNPLEGCRIEQSRSLPAFTPTPEQVHALLDLATGQRKLQFTMLAMTGLRAGELAMLRVADVDLTKGWIQVVSREDWGPKTVSSVRKIPIHPLLAEVLKEAGSRTGPYFFCAEPSGKYPAGDHFINIKHMNEHLQRLAEKTGAPVGRKNQGFVVHSLRHYFETQCVDAGVPQFVVDPWMGHSDGAEIGKTYYGRTDAKSVMYMTQVEF